MEKVSITPFSDDDRAWIKSQGPRVREFIDQFSPSDAGQPITLMALDRAFKGAVAIAKVDRSIDDDDVCRIVGAALGQALVGGGDFAWVNAKDEWGPGRAVCALQGSADFVIHPIDFVRKRWDRSETDFLLHAFVEIRKQLKLIQEKFPSEV